MRYYWMNMSCRKRDRWRLVYPPREVQRSRLGLGIDPSLLQPTTWLTKHVVFCFHKMFFAIVATVTWFTPEGVWKARGCIWLTPLLSHKIRAIEDFLTWTSAICNRHSSPPTYMRASDRLSKLLPLCQPNIFFDIFLDIFLKFSLIFSQYFLNTFPIYCQYFPKILQPSWYCSSCSPLQAVQESSFPPARPLRRNTLIFYIHIFLIAALFVEIPAVCHKF